LKNRAVQDPFAEHEPLHLRARFQVLGARMEFQSNSAHLLRLARHAFARLPVRRGTDAPLLKVLLREVPGGEPRAAPPPAPRFSSAAGLLFAHVDAHSFAVVAPSQHVASVQVSTALLHHDYHLRYELLEFAAITLAVRARGMVPLHAACVGRGRRGLLLLGDSGAGKSTMSLACALDGCAFLSDDGVFAEAEGKLHGLPGFLHIAEHGLGLVDDRRLRARLGRARRIQRRGGARKLEIDARRGDVRMARAPLELAATVVLSPARARGALLEKLDARQLAAVLRRTQPYAARQPGWHGLERALLRRGGYLLRRGDHPDEGVRALRSLLRARPA
jgi:hypothetical protein